MAERRLAPAGASEIYVSALGSQVERATRELKAFARVSLAPGETRTVTLSVPVAISLITTHRAAG